MVIDFSLAKAMLARLSFFPTLCYNMTLNVLGYRRWFDRIDDHVVLGALPFNSFASRLVDAERLCAVVSMNESYELSPYFVADAKTWRSLKIKFLQLPVQDIFNAPHQDQLIEGVSFIRAQISSSESDMNSVYVHCKAGRTRSATLVACYLMKQNHWSPQRAVKFIEERRPQLLLHKKQWEAINTFYKEQVKGKKSE